MAKKLKKCVRCNRGRAEKFYSSPRARVCSTCRKAKVAHTSKDARLTRTYQISMADFQRLLDYQDGVCAICLGKRAVLSVDHDHAKVKAGFSLRESVRGLCCRLCNGRLLTAARDDPVILRRAALYLEDPPAQRVL